MKEARAVFYWLEACCRVFVTMTRGNRNDCLLITCAFYLSIILIISPIFPSIIYLVFFLDSFSFCFQELHGLKAIIKYVYTLPSNKKNVPELITDPILLIKDVRTLIELHCHDNPHEAITGRPVLPPQVRFDVHFFSLWLRRGFTIK